MTKQTYEIDATGKILGRVASGAAAILRGKNKVTFARHILNTTLVKITNASKLKILPAKRVGKIHTRYTGYPGGLKHLSLEKMIAKKGYSEPLRLAIYGMLPANKLRAKLMNNLTITE